MNPLLYVVFIAENLTGSEVYGNMWESTDKVFFTDNLARAKKTAENFSQKYPGKSVHISQTTSIYYSKPGPISISAVNDKGEVLPV